MKLSTSIIAYLSMVTDSNAQLAKKSSKRQELTRFGWKWPKCRDIDNCGKYTRTLKLLADIDHMIFKDVAAGLDPDQTNLV